MAKKNVEVVKVALVGGAKNATFTFHVTRPDGSGVSFTLTPAAAVSLADQLNDLLDDPNEEESERTVANVVKLPRMTDRETQVFNALKLSADGNGGDFGFVEDLTRRGGMSYVRMSGQALGALLTTLQAKKIIEVHEPVTTDSGRWTQVTSDYFRM